MAILGTSGNSKFEYNSTEVTINNNVFLKFEPIVFERKLESSLTGEVYIDRIGERYLFECQSYIGEEKSFITAFNNLYQYKNRQVYCAPFAEGEYFQDSNGNKVLCDLYMRWSYLKTRNYYDLLICTFETLKPIDFSKMVLPANVIIDSNGMVQLDSNGNYQVG